MKYLRTTILILGLINLDSFLDRTFAQSGGSFEIKQSVVAAGGKGAAGGAFSVDGTMGQTVAGNNVSGAPFAVTSGFWNFALSPTAAGVSVSGRVLTANGNGLRNAVITLTNQQGTSRSMLTSSFGYYRFDDVQAGETYIISVLSKRYRFAPRIVSVADEITEFILVAEAEP
jgi:hypothetical protein